MVLHWALSLAGMKMKAEMTDTLTKSATDVTMKKKNLKQKVVLMAANWANPTMKRSSTDVHLVLLGLKLALELRLRAILWC